MNFGYSGDENFQDLLDEASIGWSIYDVKAYALGSILAPELVPPSHLFRTILAQDTEDEVQFENEDDGRRFLTEFMGLWNELTQFQGKKVAPVFSPIPDQYEELDDLIDILGARATELEHFLFGLTQGGMNPADLNGEVKEFVGVLVAGNMMLNEEAQKIENDPSEENCTKGDTLLRLIDKKWQQGFSVLESELRKLRARAFEGLHQETDPYEAPPKVGRNDPCPCGSGKKYKKCCLQ